MKKRFKWIGDMNNKEIKKIIRDVPKLKQPNNTFVSEKKLDDRIISKQFSTEIKRKKELPFLFHFGE